MAENKKLKIVYCNPSLHIAGGIERILTVKANYFVEKFGYEIHIVITDGKDSMPFFDLHSSIQVHQLNINYDEWIPLYRRFFAFFRKRLMHRRRLGRLLKQIKPDITILLVRREVSFIHTIKDGSIKIAENHIDKNRYLSSLNSSISKYLPEILIKYLKRRCVRQLGTLDRFILLTNEDKLAWNELKNIVVVPNPLTFVPEGISSCTSKQVIAVGRYEHQKGFDILLSAWQKVTAVHSDWMLKIFGDGPLRKELEQQVVQKGIVTNCFLEYPIKDISQKYLESSIFVLSSRYEGFGLVIVEAMACGLPVVSFACPCGPRDIIKDGEDGLLVENGNIERLSQQISFLIENEEYRKQMGHCALKNVQRYQMKNIAILWDNLFKELMYNKL